MSLSEDLKRGLLEGDSGVLYTHIIFNYNSYIIVYVWPSWVGMFRAPKLSGEQYVAYPRVQN